MPTMHFRLLEHVWAKISRRLQGGKSSLLLGKSTTLTYFRVIKRSACVIAAVYV